MGHKTIAVILAVVGFLGVILADENPEQKKMCWAHFVGWGFAQTDEHDQVMRHPSTRMLEPLGDRKLLGKIFMTMPESFWLRENISKPLLPMD